MVTAHTIDATLHRICHDARLEGVLLNSRGHVGVGGKGFARLRVANDFDGEQQAFAPHVSDHRVLPKFFERRAKFAAGRLDALKKSFPLDVVKHRVPSRSRHWMRVIRKAVEKSAGATGDRFGNICANHDGS